MFAVFTASLAPARGARYTVSGVYVNFGDLVPLLWPRLQRSRQTLFHPSTFNLQYLYRYLAAPLTSRDSVLPPNQHSELVDGQLVGAAHCEHSKPS